MHSRQITWNAQAGWTPPRAEPEGVSLVFYFGSHAKSGLCGLHNQTMTVTSFAEVEA